MNELPTLAPPPGVIANFDDPYSLQRYDILCQTLCFTVTTLLLAIRIYTKIHVLRRPGWDDCEQLTILLATPKANNNIQMCPCSHG